MEHGRCENETIVCDFSVHADVCYGAPSETVGKCCSSRCKKVAARSPWRSIVNKNKDFIVSSVIDLPCLHNGFPERLAPNKATSRKMNWKKQKKHLWLLNRKIQRETLRSILLLNNEFNFIIIKSLKTL